MKKRSLLTVSVLSLMLGLTSLTNTGCMLAAGASAGAGAVAWVRGELESSLNDSLNASTKATLKAIEDLKFAKVSEKQDALNAVIIARNAEDKRIEVKLTSMGDKHTKINIRVGVFGDERISLSLLDKIKSEL